MLAQGSGGSPGGIEGHSSSHAMTAGSNVIIGGLGVGSGGPDEGDARVVAETEEEL